jgi:NAD(P)-dependent dehydrogenase (short-subunit alcohol dehydrogenase family)
MTTTLSSRFSGRCAVVTGAGNGIGRASAIRLAGEGAHVVVVDIDGAAARRVAAELPTESIAVEADVADEVGVDRYLRAATDRFGGIDLHHLNAGVFGRFERLPDTSATEWDRVLAVNVRGIMLGLRGAFRLWESPTSKPGAIVVTASIASISGSADLLAYQTSKHAVVGLIHGAAMYGGPLGIRVNGVAPGIIPTDLFASAAGNVGGKNDMVTRASTTPLRRAGTAAEVAAVSAFLLSDDSSYMTGQIVSVDGGASIVNTVRPSGGAGAWDTASVDAATYER